VEAHAHLESCFKIERNAFRESETVDVADAETVEVVVISILCREALEFIRCADAVVALC